MHRQTLPCRVYRCHPTPGPRGTRRWSGLGGGLVVVVPGGGLVVVVAACGVVGWWRVELGHLAAAGRFAA